MRICERCGVSEEVEMLAGSCEGLVCGPCDAEIEAAWVAEDPENNHHYLDTFSPQGDD